jgi:hypothetical protein
MRRCQPTNQFKKRRRPPALLTDREIDPADDAHRVARENNFY